MHEAVVVRSDECDSLQADWGSVTWYANAALGNSENLSVGRCVLKPGCSTAFHHHPNCTEVVVVLDGTVAHTLSDGSDVELHAGDVITCPPEMPHRALNVGENDAVLMVTFSSPARRTENL